MARFCMNRFHCVASEVGFPQQNSVTILLRLEEMLSYDIIIVQ